MKTTSTYSVSIALLLILSTAGCGGGSDADINYVALGASDATGIGAEPLGKGYVFEIKDGLEEQTGLSVDLTNFGIPGAGADEIKDLELPLVDNENPDLITLWVGGNDLNDGTDPVSFADDLENILSDLGDTGAFVAIADLPDLTQLPRFQEEPDADVTIERIAEFNRIIRETAARHGATVVPLSDNPIEDVLVSDDGFHPSTEGHKRIAQEFLDVILPRFQNGTP